jgi:type I restriction enzyme S subunit
MRQGWVETTLGESCEFYNGKAHENQIDDQGEFIVVNSKFISSDGMTIKKTREALFPLYKNDIVMVMSDVPKGKALAKCYLIEEDNKYSLNQRICAIRSNKINTKFLYYHLNRHPHLLSFDNGENQTNLRKNDILKCPLYLPLLPEQKRIVAILDEAFEGIDRAIANTEKNLANSRKLFESYLNAIFIQKGDGWEEKKLGDISEVQSGGTPSRSKSDYWGGQIAWYSSGELNNLYTTTPERNITDKGLENSNAKLFPQGSLLIGMYDTAALKMSILDRKAAFNQAIAGVKPNDKIDLIFILHAINFMKPEILSLRRGVRQKNLSLQKIKDIVLAVPELQKQQRVVRQLASMREETQRLETIYREKLAALKELKQSILQKAFTGELTADTPKTVKEKIAA